MAREISLFPFNRLKQYSAADVALLRRLSLAYPLAKGIAISLSQIVAPLNRLIPSGVQPRLISMTLESGDSLTKDLPEKMILCILRVQPSGARAYIVAEALLGQVLSQATLTAGQLSPSDVAALTIEPVTPLVEAVMQYAVVEAMDKMQSLLGDKSFALVMEGIEGSHVLPETGKQSFFRVVLALRILERDFFVQLWLPEVLTQPQLTDPIRESARLKARIQDFARFTVDSSLQVGRVSLTSSELAEVSEGDIILLDESSLTGVGSGLQGEADFFIGDPRERLGYSVRLKISETGELQAAIEGGL